MKLAHTHLSFAYNKKHGKMRFCYLVFCFYTSSSVKLNPLNSIMDYDSKIPGVHLSLNR